MLTELQILKLQNFTTLPKFGRIVSDALLIWKKESVIPHPHVFGIKYSIENHKFKFNKWASIKGNQICCLLGAALINKKEKSTLQNLPDAVALNFKITVEDATDIYIGFDKSIRKNISIINRSDAWVFGYNVGRAVFC